MRPNITAMPRHMAGSPRLNTTVMLRRRAHCNAKTQGSKTASQHHFNAKMQSLKPASQTQSLRHASYITSMRKHRVRGLRFNTTTMPKRGARSSLPASVWWEKNSRKIFLNQLKVYNGLILRLQGREDIES